MHCGSTLVFDVWYSLRVKVCYQCVISMCNVEHKVCGSASMWEYVQSMWKYVQSMWKYVEAQVCGSMWAAVPVALRGKVGQLCAAESEESSDRVRPAAINLIGSSWSYFWMLHTTSHTFARCILHPVCVGVR